MKQKKGLVKQKTSWIKREIFKKKRLGEEYSKELAIELEKMESERQKLLKKMITEAKNNGKEVFDYKVFTDYYWRNNAFSKELSGDEAEATVYYYREKYYLDYPEVKTLKDFAKKLEEVDRALGE